MAWICASCTAEHESNDPPCRECGNEQFAQLDNTRTVERIDEVAHVDWICVDCGEHHLRNNPPCNSCGSMQIRRVEPATESDGGQATAGASAPTSTGVRPDAKSEAGQSAFASAGDILFNKSILRQLIDLELLLISGFMWIGFLASEWIYHHWKLGKGETTQYSFEGATGEGPITKFAKLLFILQLVGVAGGVLLLFAIAVAG